MKPKILLPLTAPRASASLTLAAFVGLAASSHAQTTLYWDTATTAGHQGGNGTWNTTGASFWGDSAGTATLVNWTNGNDAVFDAGTASTVTLGAPITAGTLFFNNSNFTIQQNASSSHTLAFNYLESNATSGTQNVTFSIPLNRSMNGVTGVIRDGSTGGKISVTLNASDNTRQFTLAGTNGYSGGTTITRGTLLVSSDSNLGNSSGGISIASNGTLTMGNGFSSARSISMNASGSDGLNVATGNSASLSGTIDVVSGGQLRFGSGGGTLTLTGAATDDGSTANFFTVQGLNVVLDTGFSWNNAGALLLGRTSTAASVTAKGSSTTTVGAISMLQQAASTAASLTVQDTATVSGASLNLNAAGASTSLGTVNLNGGTLTVGSVIKGTSSAGQTAVVNLNGGELKASAGDGTGTFWASLSGTTANVQAGGAKINSNSNSITIAQPLLHDPALGATLDGGLEKKGDGTLTLSGSNTYTGNTKIVGGTLTLANNSAVGTGSVTLSGALESHLQINADIAVANPVMFSSTNASSTVIRKVAANNGSNTNDDYTVGSSQGIKSNFSGGTPDTIAKILAGTNSGAATDLSMSFSGASAAANDGIRRSDVFNIEGTGNDTFVIQLSATGLPGDSVLGWLNTSTNLWENAGSSFVNAAWNSSYTSPGTFGSDGAGSYWAVVSHGGSFTVVPEPTSALAGLLIAAGLLRRRRA